ncbi:peptide deformylase [Chitinophaga sp. GCM10012297]|uniref:Peptide deformylase n=1 Tax=Chitinophaga chungangae TaxID=2821488 RepID=A0ABS3YBR5_9BACT|nr:peptide deformylase [Chitinophaga chungangae]MBO9152113.1 peptide deformylase [Chitinophaga chungangae]
MKMPILAYGHAALRQPCADVSKEFPRLKELIGSLWETMYHANGCGLAAPQTGRSLRLFIVDSHSTYEQLDVEGRAHYFHPGDDGIRETFINAHIESRTGIMWEDEEGCLSIPGITGNIRRPWSVTITYSDKDFIPRRHTFHGMTARMIQHEYDHIEGILLTDHLSGITKKLLGGKLKKIEKGQIKTAYPMKFI